MHINALVKKLLWPNWDDVQFSKSMLWTGMLSPSTWPIFCTCYVMPWLTVCTYARCTLWPGLYGLHLCTLYTVTWLIWFAPLHVVHCDLAYMVYTFARCTLWPALYGLHLCTLYTVTWFIWCAPLHTVHCDLADMVCTFAHCTLWPGFTYMVCNPGSFLTQNGWCAFFHKDIVVWNGVYA